MSGAPVETIGSRLAARGGFGPGFDWIRIVLAVSVAATHINSIVPRDAGDLSALAARVPLERWFGAGD